MAYKHLIQKDSPYVVYPLDIPAVNGQYQQFGGIDTKSASIVDSSNTFSTSNTLPYYNYPLVLGNNISTYINSNKKIKLDGRGFFTEKTKNSAYTIEFWMRHYGNDYNTPVRILSASSSDYSGLWLDGQYLSYKYGDSTASSVVETSIGIDKYDVPMHVVMIFNPDCITLWINGVKKIKAFNPETVYLNPYNTAKDFLFIGSLNNLEISNISMYTYDILENSITDRVLFNHFIYGQGYEVSKSQYEIRGGMSNTLSLQESSPIVPIDAKTIFDGNNYISTWKSYQNLLHYGTMIGNEGLTVKSYTFNGVLSVSDLTRSANTASGTPLQKGSYIEFEDIKNEMSEYNEQVGLEISLYHSMPPETSASNTLIYLQGDYNSSVWVYMTRQTSASSRIEYKIYNRAGNLLTASSLYPGAYIANGKEFKIGIAQRNNPTSLEKEFIIYAKNSSTTASIAFNTETDSNSFLREIYFTRIGTTNEYDYGFKLADITNDYSWTSPSLLYVNSIILGNPTDILNNSYAKYYKKIQFDFSKNRFKLGVYSASAILPISFFNLGIETGASYTIYPNRLDFSFPNQINNSNAASAIQVYRYIYTASVLTASSRIYGPQDIFVQPRTYSNKDEVAASAVHAVFVFNDDDIEYKLPVMKSVKALFMKDNYINSYTSPDMKPIELVYSNNASVTIPSYKTTKFINNPVSDGGILIGSSSYYGIINLSEMPLDAVRTISFFVKSASLYNSTILMLNTSSVFSHILNGASAFVNTSIASAVYQNGASVSLTTGSISATTNDWNRYDIVLSTPLTIPASIVIGASGMVSNNRFFIDEIAIFSKKFTERDAYKINSLFENAYTSTISVKDGASPTINMTNTYGSTSSSRVMISLIDEEISGSGPRFTDKIQLLHKEVLTYVRALKTSDSATTTSPETFTSIVSEQYVDGIKLSHNDKVLTITPTGSIAYTASYNSSNTQIKFTSASSLTASSVYYIQNGNMFGNRYLSMDMFSGTLKPNIEVDKAKIKYIKRRIT